MSIEILLKDKKYDFVKKEDKEFIIQFTNTMSDMGYTFSDRITDGICWGKYMMIFTKVNVKSKKVYARIYLKEDQVTLRYFMSDVTKHSEYIAKTPDYINNTFTGDYGKCNHCKGEVCKFRKCYSIDGIDYEKCNGITFEFFQPSVERINEYIRLFKEFYPVRKIKE